MATDRELSDFLQSVEKRAFKRTVYHVRDEESALDIVQDSMMKLAEHYGEKPPAELPMLFQRILSNCTLDWFRRQKTRNALFSNLSDFESSSEDGGDFDLLETYSGPEHSQQVESAEDATRRAQTLREIEVEIMELPARQREAFLMRYWEDMDVAETAAANHNGLGFLLARLQRAHAGDAQAFAHVVVQVVGAGRQARGHRATESLGGGGQALEVGAVHSCIPFAFSALLRAWTAREQCVLTLPSEQPMAAAVSATSISSQ